MGRKVFQDFAHVLCQKFVEVPSNRDLVDLAILGDGILRLNITERKATHSGFPIEPLPFTERALLWIESRLNDLAISRAELLSAALTVESGVKLHRRPGLPFLCFDLVLRCSASVRASDREYVSNLTAEKSWGLSIV
jgi:hypothetical protein